MDGIELYNIFLESHKPQLEMSGVPRLFWEILYKKLKNQFFDAGNVFRLVSISYEDAVKEPRDPLWKLFVSAENGINAEDPNNIYLIDHAWMYDAMRARQNLQQIPNFLDRMCNLMGYDGDDHSEEARIEFVLCEMWRYNNSFYLNSGTIEDRVPVWYIMDEVGSAINHNDNPNFRAVPFLHIPESMVYTILFPIKNVKYDEEVTRDFVEGQTNDPKKRKSLLLPWVDYDGEFRDEKIDQIEPDENYFLAGHVEESLPELIDEDTISCRSDNTKLNVFAQYSLIKEYLTNIAFEIVDNEEEADILWFTSHFKKYKELSLNKPHVYVNQFPFENVITIKDLLSIICRRKAKNKQYDPETLDTYPSWLPTTFNLNTELVQFVAYFQRRESKGLDNHWICKPWNLARSLDIHVTNNLYHILRLPSTGPKIAQKYISNPVLYDRPEVGRVKFDVRYVILLVSTKPLKAYAYANFFLRFANKEFALNNFDVYEQHFTVMNYSEDSSIFHVKCADFLLEWEKQYPNYPWKTDIEPKILTVFKDMFEAAVSVDPPKGIARSPQSRAMYAADLMLEWKTEKIEPALLEVNFTPDCKRACQYYPEFFNDIFQCMFLNEVNPAVFHKLHSDS